MTNFLRSLAEQIEFLENQYNFNHSQQTVGKEPINANKQKKKKKLLNFKVKIFGLRTQEIAIGTG